MRISEVQSEDGVGEQVPWVLQFGVHEVFASDYRIYRIYLIEVVEIRNITIKNTKENHKIRNR